MNTFLSSNSIDRDINKVIEFGNEYNLNIEFSSNIKYSKNNIDSYKKYKNLKLTHNYFPASYSPFVFNLASINNEVKNKTIDLCKINIDLASDSKIPVYSFHAGFAFEPKFKNLGKNFVFDNNKKKDYYNNFEFELDKILNYAIKKNVIILVENNVTILSNFKNNYSPLFCSSASDIIKLAQKFDCCNFGILFDTAHHKVSSTTFGNQLEDKLDLLYPYIKAVHHSDNNSLRDTNEKIENNYWWFSKKRPLENCIFQVLEVKKCSVEEIKIQFKLLENYNDTCI